MFRLLKRWRKSSKSGVTCSSAAERSQSRAKVTWSLTSWRETRQKNELSAKTQNNDATIWWTFDKKTSVQFATEADPIYMTRPLFVFSIDDPKQNATSLLTPVSDIVFYALSSGTLGFALHGSSVNHFLIGGNSSTANQILSCKWFIKLPRRAKPRVPLERA